MCLVGWGRFVDEVRLVDGSPFARLVDGNRFDDGSRLVDGSPFVRLVDGSSFVNGWVNRNGPFISFHLSSHAKAFVFKTFW